MYRDQKKESAILVRMAEVKNWRKAKPAADCELEFQRRVNRWYEEAYTDDKMCAIFDDVVEEDNGGIKLYEKAE